MTIEKIKCDDCGKVWKPTEKNPVIREDGDRDLCEKCHQGIVDDFTKD